MKIYPSYDSLAIDLDLHFFDKVNVLRNAGNPILIDDNKYWFVVSDDGCCHLFDENGNLDDINKLHILKEYYVRKDVKKIIIPDSVTSIEDWALNCCSGLTSVTISDGVTRIGDYVFCFCSELTSVTIPNSIEYISHNAFWRCGNIKNLFFKGKTIKEIKVMKNYPWRIKDENVIKVS